MYKIIVIYIYIAPGHGQANAQVSKVFKNISSVNLIICCKFFPI